MLHICKHITRYTTRLSCRNLSENVKVEIGQKATLTRTILQSDVDRFRELSGDTNPVHSGAEAVVHGALLNSFVSCVMGTQLPGPGSMVVSQALKYPNPCHVGDTITLTVTVVGTKVDLIKCRYIMLAKQGENVACPVLTGDAAIIMCQDQQRRAAAHKTTC